MSIGEILILSRDDVRKVLTAKDTLERCEDTFRWIGNGEIEQLHPVTLPLPSSNGSMQVYPSHVKPLKKVGIKWQGGFLDNMKRGLPFLSAIDIINDAETGMPVALIDGTSVTGMRTAGHAGIGAKYCARQNSSILAIIGCGFEGRTHLTIMNELFDIKEVRIFDISTSAQTTFQKEMSELLRLKIIPFPSVKEAVTTADIICMVTTAKEPILMDEWVNPGCHVCGAFGYTDINPICAKKFDKWVVGFYDHDLEWIEGPETGVIGGLKLGQYSKSNIYADLATEIIPGKKPGRTSDNERTIMTHMGMPALDVAVATMVYDRSVERGIGTLMKIF